MLGPFLLLGSVPLAKTVFFSSMKMPSSVVDVPIVALIMKMKL